MGAGRGEKHVNLHPFLDNILAAPGADDGTNDAEIFHSPCSGREFFQLPTEADPAIKRCIGTWQDRSNYCGRLDVCGLHCR